MEATVAVQAHRPENPTAGSVVTPPPTRPAPPDVVSQARRGGDGYSQNGPAGNVSSLPPGVGGPQSALAKNMRATVVDPLLDQLAAHGHNAPDLQSPQTRTISAVPLASAHAQQKRGVNSGSPGGVIPQKIGATDGTVARKPPSQ
jgi:hypothetical protein